MKSKKNLVMGSKNLEILLPAEEQPLEVKVNHAN